MFLCSLLSGADLSGRGGRGQGECRTLLSSEQGVDSGGAGRLRSSGWSLFWARSVSGLEDLPLSCSLWSAVLSSAFHRSRWAVAEPRL